MKTYNAKPGEIQRDWVVVDPRLLRPTETMSLLGDASKARRVLGWSPTIGFEELVREMVECDLAELQAAQRRTAAEVPR